MDYIEPRNRVLWGNRLYLRARSPYIQSLIARPMPLLTDSFCQEQSMITNGPLRKKSRKGEIRLEVLVSVVALAETRVQVVQNRTSVFIKIQIQVIVRITFRIQVEFRIG